MRALILVIVVVSALLLLFGCGSGGQDTPVEDTGVALDTQAEEAPTYHKLPPDAGAPDSGRTDSLRASDIPFGPPEPDVSNCPCGIGCVMTLAPDKAGYYCRRVCMACP